MYPFGAPTVRGEAHNASVVGPNILQIDVESGGLRATQTWLLSDLIPPGNRGCQYTQYDVSDPIDIISGSVVLGTVDMVSALYKSDPFVALSVAVTAGASDTTFTISSATVAFDAITNPDAYAVASLTVIDNNGNGAALTGLYPGGKAYQTTYANGGGAATWASLTGSFAASANRTKTFADAYPADNSVPIVDTLYNIQSQYYFQLSAYDSATGTSHFEITPEPATLSLLALGGLALLRRRK